MSIRKSRKSRMGFSALSIAKKVYQIVDSPFSLKCFLLLVNEEWDQLAELDLDPTRYTNAQDYFLDAQCLSVLKKYPEMDTSFNRQQRASVKFLESERQCEVTNQRLWDRSGSQKPARADSILHRAQLKIAQILGDEPSVDDLDCRFGPGASLGTRKRTSVYNKVTNTLECTREMLPILGDLFRSHPAWIPEGSLPINIVEGSELTFVPKSAKIDRPICIEPVLNGFLQKGIGSYIRKRLRRFGVNLNDQSINQRLAMTCHERELSTIDFSSASDTISYALVLDLLPVKWFDLLECCRCSHYTVKGSEHIYEFNKFSSMGNGYTFELETLIFYSIAFATCEELGIQPETGMNLHVYGDDVILPRAAFNLFSEICNYAGFSVNLEKSFRDGSFFESCGHDYYEGTFVRPFYIKKRLKTLEDYYYVTNEVLRTCEKLCKTFSTSRTSRTDALEGFRELHAWCISRIPYRFRLPIPDGVGDGGLVADFDVANPTRTSCGSGFVYRHRVNLPLKIPISEAPMIYALYHLSDPPNPFSSKPLRPSEAGGFYQVRNHYKTVTAVSNFYGEWPLAPFTWNERAIHLMARGGTSA